MSEERARMSSVLGATGLVLGNVQGQGDFEVRGRVQGDIVLNGRVLVSAGGMVLGTIEAVHISISGTVRGDLIAEDGVEIAGSGQVDGNVTSPRVAIEAGAKVRGHLRTGEEPPPARRGAPEPLSQVEPSEEPDFEAASVDVEATPSEPPPALVVPPRAALPREGALAREAAPRGASPAAEVLDAKGPGAKRRRKRRRDRDRDRDGQGPPTDAAGTSPSHVDEGRAEFTPPLRPTRPSGPLPPADRPSAARVPVERTAAERTPAERTPAERAPAERTPAQRGPRERPSAEARKDAKPADDGSPERPRRGKPLPTFVKGARGHLRG